MISFVLRSQLSYFDCIYQIGHKRIPLNVIMGKHLGIRIRLKGLPRRWCWEDQGADGLSL